MSEHPLDRLLDDTLARAGGEPAEFDVQAGKLALAQALKSRTTEQELAPAVGAEAPVKRRTAVRWLAAAAAVGVLTTGGLVASTIDITGKGSGIGRGPLATASAAEWLNRAAAIADKVQVQPLAPGQYRYVHTRYSGIVQEIGSNKAWTQNGESEEWVPANPNDEWMLINTDGGGNRWVPGHEGPGEPDKSPKGLLGEFRGKCGHYSYMAEGQLSRCERPAEWYYPTPEFIATLPKDPKALYERMAKDGQLTSNSKDSPAMGVMRSAIDGLRSGFLPADVRANVFRALALTPGLVVTDERANLDGKQGVAIGYKVLDNFEEIIIDPSNGEFIGQRSVTADHNYSNLEKGTVNNWTSVTTAVVGKLGERP